MAQKWRDMPIYGRARNNGRSTISDRQEIAFDRQRSKVADHFDWQEPSSQKHG
jgi:hypothetical protein